MEENFNNESITRKMETFETLNLIKNRIDNHDNVISQKANSSDLENNSSHPSNPFVIVALALLPSGKIACVISHT